MCVSINSIRNKNGFTILELLVASFVAFLVIAGIWSVYVIGWAWWHEAIPKIEMQQIVRQAISSIIDGSIDSGAGTDYVSGIAYGRRNGIAWATGSPLITSTANEIKITYNLEGLGSQSFFVNLTEEPRKVYHNSAGNPVRGTEGITDISFQLVQPNLILVTAKAEKDIVGTRALPYHIKVEESQTIFLRNVITP